ncbi:MAG: Rpn family recombination-promoting nuclease/putative transposase [Gammaproteobacteria bacterium]|nr:Rpn family recombination-promoting nuclease/putative transposase [Gammaproteobacteria bacterium]
MFPLVVYNGRGRWKAKRSVAELITPISSSLRAYRPNQHYYLLDESAIPIKRLQQAQSIAAEIIRTETESGQGIKVLQAHLHQLNQILEGEAYRDLRRTISVWLQQVVFRRVMPGQTLPELNDLNEVEAQSIGKFC